ncbi:MAG: enoyl-CoA hydratase/isomerase family protein [Gammaproteobacteria bacterium]|nr:enoyl-CoA hydratase/isomerase family protein [Gammaproteobacteria bacterium]
MKTYETIASQMVREHILLLTLNRPDAANSLNTQMGLDLFDFWTEMYRAPGDVRCIVLTGSGERAFCAGGDLKQRNGMTDQEWMYQHAVFEQAHLGLMDCPVPVIAAVNGAAYGGGSEMALACDFIYAARRARFALTEVTLGIIPGNMGTQNLPRAVGVRRAKEIILTGKPIDAQQAFDWGLVNRVCDDDALLSETLETAEHIAANAPLSTRQAKKSMTVATQVDLKNGFSFELEAYNRLVPTQDRLEGVNAFNEKRKPKFTGQ